MKRQKVTKNTVNCPIKIIDYKKFYDGTIYRNNRGELFKIINYQDNKHVEVQFLDEFGHRKIVEMNHLLDGKVGNPYHRSSTGGYIGEGPYATHHFDAIKSWRSMLKNIGNNVTLDPNWYNFQYFAQWYYDYKARLTPGIRYFFNYTISQWGQPQFYCGPQTACLITERVQKFFNSMKKNQRPNSSNLPLGVDCTGTLYMCRIFNDGELTLIGRYETPMEAFEKFKELKTQALHELADSEVAAGTMTPEIRDIIYQIEIQPY